MTVVIPKKLGFGWTLAGVLLCAFALRLGYVLVQARNVQKPGVSNEG